MGVRASPCWTKATPPPAGLAHAHIAGKVRAFMRHLTKATLIGALLAGVCSVCFSDTDEACALSLSIEEGIGSPASVEADGDLGPEGHRPAESRASR